MVSILYPIHRNGNDTQYSVLWVDIRYGQLMGHSALVWRCFLRSRAEETQDKVLLVIVNGMMSDHVLTEGFIGRFER